tara:strand:+ start:95 stop:1237 length:1143 start_codon:yes stop_codon:yes gene_type:complete
MDIKKILLFSFILSIFIETASFIASKNELLIFNSKPGYLKFKSIYNALDWRTEEEAWGAWHKKNFLTRHEKKCFDVYYKTNDVGARSEFSFNNLKSDNNLVLLGDSFAEGVGVSNEYTLAGLLNDKYKTTLNFGSGGNFGPLQTFLIYQNLAKKFPHNEVVFLFLPANDFIDNDFDYYKKYKMTNRYRPYFKKINEEKFGYFYPSNSSPQKDFPYENIKNTNYEKIKNFLKEYFWSYNLVKTVKYTLISRKNPYTVQNDNFGYFFSNKTSVEATIYFINKLFKEIDKNFEKTVMIIPTEKDLKNIMIMGNSYKKLKWYKELEKLSNEQNVKIIDLAMENNGEYSLTHIEDGISNWFLSCDGHWSEKGNKMAFQKLIFTKK